MARRDNRLIRLCEEVAGMPVIDLTKANERRIERHHHTCIHGQDLRRIGSDRFRMRDAPASLANMKANLAIVPAVNESRS